jgi:hypothetical protein
MGGELLGVGRPVVALPVDEMRRGGNAHALPPDIAVVRQGDVCEDGVLLNAQHRVGVTLHRGARYDAEETGLGIDGVKPPVLSEVHPGDIVADGLHLPAGMVGMSMARFVLPVALGKAPVIYFLLPWGSVTPRISMCSAIQPSSRAWAEAMRRAKHFLPRSALPP